MRIPITPDRLSTLPKWAQEEIRRLRLKVESLNRLVAEAHNGNQLNELSYTDVRTDVTCGLPKYAFLKAFRDTKHEISIRPVEGGVEVSATRGRIVIHPSVTNVVQLYATGSF